MQPDLEKYRPYLKRFDLTDEEKDEFLLSLWTMLEGVADRAFGTHPFQQAVDNSPIDDSRDSGLRVEFRDTNSKR
tara:strand:+ start:2099 stop:2323 length:225 start_codon:yes stop_codon:yes gene_type:complete